MQTPPAKYADVIEWLTSALEGIGGNNGKIVLNVNGGAIEADLETTSTELDNKGRKVKVKRVETTRIRLEAHRPVVWR